MVSFSKYPFLFTIEDYSSVIYGYTIELEELFVNERLVELAVERLTSALSRRHGWGKTLSGDELFLTFHMAAVLAKQMGARSVITRFALNEADRAYIHLFEETVENIVMIASRLGIGLEHLEAPLIITVLKTRKGRVVRWLYDFKLPISDYIRYTLRLRGDPKWKLVNRPVKEGFVYMEKREVLRFLKEAFYYKIIDLVDAIELAPSNIEAIVEKVKENLPKAGRGTLRIDGRRRVVYDALPPCIKRIHEALVRGENLSHAERFAYATFMLAIGASIDELVELFRNLPDFKEKITRYQLEHLAGKRGGGKRYSPYNCDNMRSRGLCVADCGVSHPLTYYAKKKRGHPRSGGDVEAGEQIQRPHPRKS